MKAVEWYLNKVLDKSSWSSMLIIYKNGSMSKNVTHWSQSRVFPLLSDACDPIGVIVTSLLNSNDPV